MSKLPAILIIGSLILFALIYLFTTRSEIPSQETRANETGALTPMVPGELEQVTSTPTP